MNDRDRIGQEIPVDGPSQENPIVENRHEGPVDETSRMRAVVETHESRPRSRSIILNAYPRSERSSPGTSRNDTDRYLRSRPVRDRKTSSKEFTARDSHAMILTDMRGSVGTDFAMTLKLCF